MPVRRDFQAIDSEKGSGLSGNASKPGLSEGASGVSGDPRGEDRAFQPPDRAEGAVPRGGAARFGMSVAAALLEKTLPDDPEAEPVDDATQRLFDAMDSDANGIVTKAEFSAFREAIRRNGGGGGDHYTGEPVIMAYAGYTASATFTRLAVEAINLRF